MLDDRLRDDPLARGRARLEQDLDGAVRIVIPAKREWPMLLFLMFWLGGWTVGGVTVIGALVTGTEPGSEVFSLFWLGAWALGWLFAASVLGWALLGREIVEISGDALSVSRVAGPYRRTRLFQRDHVKRVRTEPYEGALRSMFNVRASWRHGVEMWGLGGGAIVFDYGARTHRFGSKLDDAESRQLAKVVQDELGGAPSSD